MVEKLLQQVINETKKLNKDERFIVKDLFVGYQWNRIPISVRMELGRLFKNYIDSNRINIVALDKTKCGGQQKYKIT